MLDTSEVIKEMKDQKETITVYMSGDDKAYYSVELHYIEETSNLVLSSYYTIVDQEETEEATETIGAITDTMKKLEINLNDELIRQLVLIKKLKIIKDLK